MEECNEYMRCPMCAEDIRVEAAICHHCMTDLYNEVKFKEGRFVKVRLKVDKKTYNGDVFVHGCTKRVSDVVNDKRLFISMLNTHQEMESSSHDLEIGYMAFNKRVVEWVQVDKDGPEEGH